MLLTLQGNRSLGSLAHPSWVPYRYHKYALDHIHACNIHHYQHWYTALYIIIWREELTNSFGFVLRIVQGFRLAIRVHVQIYGRLICGCSGAECLNPAVHGAKYFQATACMARISWCFCCISWCCARKVACSRFLKRCWEALTGWKAQHFPWHSDVWSFRSRCIRHIGSANGSSFFLSTLIV